MWLITIAQADHIGITSMGSIYSCLSRNTEEEFRAILHSNCADLQNSRQLLTDATVRYYTHLQAQEELRERLRMQQEQEQKELALRTNRSYWWIR